MSFTQKVHIKGSPQQVFEAITVQVQQWWGYTDFPVHKVGDTFTTRFEQTHWKFRITAFEPFQKIVWTCVEALHVHEGYENIEQEWIDTSVEWKLEATGENETLLHFTHQGLVPETELLRNLLSRLGMVRRAKA